MLLITSVWVIYHGIITMKPYFITGWNGSIRRLLEGFKFIPICIWKLTLRTHRITKRKRKIFILKNHSQQWFLLSFSVIFWKKTEETNGFTTIVLKWKKKWNISFYFFWTFSFRLIGNIRNKSSIWKYFTTKAEEWMI